jgi:CheY-like chemotaxis protein
MARSALVVDDSEIARAFIIDILQKLDFGYIREAADGAECVEIVRAIPPDIIFLDIEMPGMDGLEALKTIRSFNRSVVVIMMTAVANADVVDICKNIGTDYYVLKDMSEEKIERRIRQIFERVRRQYVWPRNPVR